MSLELIHPSPRSWTTGQALGNLSDGGGDVADILLCHVLVDRHADHVIERRLGPGAQAPHVVDLPSAVAAVERVARRAERLLLGERAQADVARVDDVARA